MALIADFFVEGAQHRSDCVACFLADLAQILRSQMPSVVRQAHGVSERSAPKPHSLHSCSGVELFTTPNSSVVIAVCSRVPSRPLMIASLRISSALNTCTSS